MAEPSNENVKRTLSELEDDEACISPSFIKSDNVTPAKRKKSVSSGLPEVFEMDELTHDQRLAAYLTIFQQCTPAMVIAALAECMRENIAKTGWRAVWKPTEFSSFILVQVEEAPVSDGFQALIRIDDSALAVESDDEGEGQTSRSAIETYLSVHDNTVSLTELSPVYDESGYLDDTALALEHLRFFMKYLWRLSDEEDEGSYSFLERTLVPRLKFYYEMSSDVLPESLVVVYTECMKEYKEKRVLLSKMQSQLSDSDTECEDLNESRIALSIMAVHQELEALETKMERMENPTLRHMVTSLCSIDGLNSSPKSVLATNLQTRISESSSEAVTHLVGERVTAGMIQDLHLPRETFVQSHTSISDAVSASDDGDIILLFPGTHSASGLANFYFSLTFIGLGNPEDTIISCRGLMDALDLSGSSVSFQNIKFYDEQCSWLLSSSNSKSFEAINCIFEGGGVQLYGNGEMKLEECEIFGALAYGVCILSGSRATLKNCNIHNNGSNTGEDCGILIEVDTRDHMDSTLVDITGNRIHHNQGPGLLMVDSEEGQKIYQDRHLKDLEAITNFKGALNDNSFQSNVGGDFKQSVKLTEQDEKASELEEKDVSPQVTVE
ncbi:putative SHC SH2 domain-binding protein 1 [Apostichopus japonicus]|uniref:Putative SHC SH2 domain-binding protein 1 n=1 Tax=Stichopus japonicus TaxID=307972 RepID=A0A2G8KRA5_STIJA|nr:putative SHC SH2 domain-binding protein 1 [Apostichopus japonicus]